MAAHGCDVQDGSLGQALGLATTAAFFTAFDFIAYEPAKPIGGGQVWHGYRPADPRFHGLATLNLETDQSEVIDRLTLCLDRAGLLYPGTGAFLRHIAGDFLNWALPAADQAAVAELVVEIHGSATSDLRPFPSPGYRAFLGHEGEAEFSLASSELRIVNLNWRRHPDDVATPPGYDRETMWLWLTVRRHSS